MRKARYGIGLFLAAALLAWGYYGSFRLRESREDGSQQLQAAEQQRPPAAEEEAPAEPDSGEEGAKAADAEVSPCYLIKEEDGYLKVYLENGELYEDTGIRADRLPEWLRAQVRSGLAVEGSRGLYGFLENYSS